MVGLMTAFRAKSLPYMKRLFEIESPTFLGYLVNQIGIFGSEDHLDEIIKTYQIRPERIAIRRRYRWKKSKRTVTTSTSQDILVYRRMKYKPL